MAFARDKLLNFEKRLQLLERSFIEYKKKTGEFILNTIQTKMNFF